ncbi:Xyloglucan endotransglucosylase protein 1 [Linum perenne]
MAKVLHFLFLFMSIASTAHSAANFHQEVDLTWGGDRGRITDEGNTLSLSLDKDSGSGFRFMVDNIAIRVYENRESVGVAFPKTQPMKLYSSLWNADQWATRGGLVKTDWSKAPFTAYYRNFNTKSSSSTKTAGGGGNDWQTQKLDAGGRRWIKWAQKADFNDDIDITWGHDHAKISDDGSLLSLTLDRFCGAGFQSKKAFLYGKFDVDMKLPPGNSAGIVTTFYIKCDSVYVDNIPIRVFNNREAVGIPYPNRKPMKLKASIWNGEKWATRGGLVKTDWTQAPFTAFYRNLRIQTLSGDGKQRQRRPAWPMTQGLDKAGKNMLRWVRQTRMIYNYCTDRRRHPGECDHFIDI